MILYRETGKRIQILLADRGISVRRLQEQMGLESSQAIYKWLHGKSLPSLEHAVSLSRILGVAVEELLAFSREAEQKPIYTGNLPAFLESAPKGTPYDGWERFVLYQDWFDRLWGTCFFARKLMKQKMLEQLPSRLRYFFLYRNTVWEDKGSRSGCRTLNL